MEKLYWVISRGGKQISTIVHVPQNTASSKGKSPVIVYFHGFAGNKTVGNRMGVKLARRLCAEGYLVVRFDYIGSGESEGDFETDTFFTGWIEDAQIVLAWTKTLENADLKRIGIIGHSLGGALVTHLSASDKTLKSICTLSPVSYLERNFEQIILGPALWADLLRGQTIRNFNGSGYSLSSLFAQDIVRYNILESAGKISQPILIIHGKKDQVVPVANSYDLERSLVSPNKRLEVFEDEGHLFSEKIYLAVIDWFKNTL
ncbi:alpha/beta fold hydrolase [Peribacillus cavernae]|uniref:Alpha/beta fold hydrolase n=1 Tax=Peribacillus cavernae TaxID=1674310 RepID=A0A3S0U203_9BACI|nr:alpha/beta fold hydrolase [Peribacillus cavernae]MDQ0219139.1 dipeptidyl aminopeptidase/acylaminoacyl peptidase [Peribacillus cavernae]RUQ28631.1 alpha/beta fold hydrolase [Peribacillus cavernae]